MKTSIKAVAALAMIVLCGLWRPSINGRADHLPAQPQERTAKYGGIYRINEPGDVRTLDPVRLNDIPSQNIANQIYELLVDYDSSMQIRPELAERWEVSRNGLTYTFHLRKGVRFQDADIFPKGKGRELTAADVKSSLDRLVDARSGTLAASYFTDRVRGASQFYRATGSPALKPDVAAQGVSGFRVVDDHTFSISLLRPYSPFIHYLALGFCYIYPREAIRQDSLGSPVAPVGTGPFILRQWKPGQLLTLGRNPRYWQRDKAGDSLPYLDSVVVNFGHDERGDLEQFRKGGLSEVFRIPQNLLRLVLDADGKPSAEWRRFRLEREPALSVQYYGMLTTEGVFNDRRVRQAFNYAIDREAIIRNVLEGVGGAPAMHGLVPASVPGYDAASVRGYGYDIEKARGLMAQAGYPDGKGFPPVTLQLNAGAGLAQRVAGAVQKMLGSGLGVSMSLKQVPWPQHLELLEAGKSPLFRSGWIADYPDPENFLNLLYGRNIPDNGPSPINTSRYTSLKFDELFEQALATDDSTDRARLFQQADQVAVDDAPLLLLYYDLEYRLVQPYVRGFISNGMNRRDLTATWLDRGDKR
jgi:peptide/nickel transport system substrate-binding protein